MSGTADKASEDRLTCEKCGGFVTLEASPEGKSRVSCATCGHKKDLTPSMRPVRDDDATRKWIVNESGDAEIDVRPANEPWDIGLGEKPAGLTTRRYIAMHKANARTEAGGPPTPAQSAAWAKLIDEMQQAGVLLATASLEPSSKAVRLRNFGGKKTLVDGPFAESKELVGGFVIVDLESRAEAIDWAQRYVDVLGDVELDIRTVADWSTFAQ